MTEEYAEDELFEVLGSGRRREIIRVLEAQNDELVRAGTIADKVAEREADRRPPGEDEPTNVRNSIYNTAVQNHLPRMDAVGVVEFHPDTKHAMTGPNFEVTYRVLEVAVTELLANGTGGTA